MATELLKLRAETLTAEGFCTAQETRHGIYGALPGEEVNCSPIRKKARRLFCRTESVITAHPDRVEPRCSAAAFCGGCSLQHVDHDAQVAFKQERLAGLFADKPPAVWLPPMVADAYGYRSKARLGVKRVDKKNRVLVGFRETLKPYIAETDSCPVLRAPVDQLIDPLAELIESLDASRTIPQVEVAVGDDRTALVFRHLELLSPADAEALLGFGVALDVDIYLQPGAPETTTKIYPYGTSDRLGYHVAGINMQFHPQDFTQVNAAINRQMVDTALGLLDLERTDRVLDTFCGIGNFSLPIALLTGAVHGVELSATSVDRARENARANGITNATFDACDLFRDEGLGTLVAGYNKVMIDPPRTGAEALCQVLASSDVERVVYVSCKPETLSRDVDLLVSSGFHLEKLGLIDMFPHTMHMESLALLTRDGNG